MLKKKKDLEPLVRLFPFFVFFLFTSLSFADSPGEKPQPPGTLSESLSTPALLGQALINSDPRNLEGYKLLVDSQRANAQWLDLLDTAGKAEQNGISDPFLYRQMAAAFWELRLLPQNFNTLMLAEVWAREYDK